MDIFVSKKWHFWPFLTIFPNKCLLISKMGIFKSVKKSPFWGPPGPSPAVSKKVRFQKWSFWDPQKVVEPRFRAGWCQIFDKKNQKMQKMTKMTLFFVKIWRSLPLLKQCRKTCVFCGRWVWNASPSRGRKWGQKWCHFWTPLNDTNP